MISCLKTTWFCPTVRTSADNSSSLLNRLWTSLDENNVVQIVVTVEIVPALMCLAVLVVLFGLAGVSRLLMWLVLAPVPVWLLARFALLGLNDVRGCVLCEISLLIAYHLNKWDGYK